MKPAPVGELELAALLSVVRLREHAYGARIRRDLSERAARDYSIGAIYTTLQRLEDKGLVTSEMSEPTAVRGGRAKRQYRVSADGELVIRREHDAQAAFWRGIPTKLRTV